MWPQFVYLFSRIITKSYFSIAATHRGMTSLSPLHRGGLSSGVWLLCCSGGAIRRGSAVHIYIHECTLVTKRNRSPCISESVWLLTFASHIYVPRKKWPPTILYSGMGDIWRMTQATVIIAEAVCMYVCVCAWLGTYMFLLGISGSFFLLRCRGMGPTMRPDPAPLAPAPDCRDVGERSPRRRKAAEYPAS